VIGQTTIVILLTTIVIGQITIVIGLTTKVIWQSAKDIGQAAIQMYSDPANDMILYILVHQKQ
jgi:hypothetical protein